MNDKHKEIIDTIYEAMFSNIASDSSIKTTPYNSVDYHNMGVLHTEVLGSFLDYAPMDPERLKLILLRGYLESLT